MAALQGKFVDLQGSGLQLTNKLKPPALSARYAGSEQIPSCSMYLCGLPLDINQQALNLLIGSAGFSVIQSRLFPDKNGGGLASALVMFSSREECAAAIRAFHGRHAQLPQLSEITVQFHGSGTKGARKLLVAGLPVGCDSAMVERMFAAVGFIVMSTQVRPATSRFGRRMAVVEMASYADAVGSIQALHGQAIEIEVAQVGNLAPATGQGERGCASSMKLKYAGEDQTSGKAAAVLHLNDQPAPRSLGSPSIGDGPRSTPVADRMPRMINVKYAGAGDPSEVVYVSGLPDGVSFQAVQAMFASAGFGTSFVRVLPDIKGFGICSALVTLSSQEAAAGVIRRFDRKTVDMRIAGPQGRLPFLKVRCVGTEQAQSENVDISGFSRSGPVAPSELHTGSSVSAPEAEVADAVGSEVGESDSAAAKHAGTQPTLLPPAWQQVWSEEFGCYYYVDVEAQHVQWEQPTHIPGDWRRHINTDGAAFWESAALGRAFYEDGCTSWQRFVDLRGRTYWSNAEEALRFFEDEDEGSRRANYEERTQVNSEVAWGEEHVPHRTSLPLQKPFSNEKSEVVEDQDQSILGSAFCVMSTTSSFYWDQEE